MAALVTGLLQGLRSPTGRRPEGAAEGLREAREGSRGQETLDGHNVDLTER